MNTELRDPYRQHPEVINRWIAERQSLLRRESEDYLRDVVLDYEPRRAAYWQRDYSSTEAYLQSVEANRRRWRHTVGAYEADGTDLAPQLDLWYEDGAMQVWWLTIGLLGGEHGLHGRAMLALPKGRPGSVPLVIAQHGIGGGPERVFGLDDSADLYKSYGRRLAECGFAVLAPMNVTDEVPRARLERLCKMVGKSLWGLEIYRTRRLLDYAETRPEIDITRTAMYGISLGGAYTMFTTPLEPRISAAVVCAWFNHRRNKMALDDPRYSTALSKPEEHMWLPGWLREFTDSDLVSLICPRPLLVEQGKADGVAWWPMVLAEYEEAVEHYRRLGVAGRIQIDLHEGGHEIRLAKSLSFLVHWLQP